MVQRVPPAAEGPKPAEAARILSETARAVKVMKASWLRVALNLKEIRRHELWRLTSPPCSSYEDYAYGVLKLNRAVERRMLQAMEYAEERRPRLIQEFVERDGDLEVPSYETVNQLRRAEEAFQGRPEEWRSLEDLVFEQNAGRVALKREIQERLGSGEGAAKEEPQSKADSLQAVIQDLMAIESRLRKLQAGKEARRLCFELIEALHREARGPGAGS